MKILAIDPGFERVGIAVIEQSKKNKEHLLYSACFKTSAKLPFSKRLGAIGRELERIIKKYKPKALAIETLFFNTNQRTVMRVSEARGAIIYVAQNMGLDIFEYSPLQIKIAITGYGKASKEQVMRMLPQLIELDVKTPKADDEYDAIAIALTHSATTSPVYTERS